MIIIGVGGHSKVVYETLKCNKIEVNAFYDDDLTKIGRTFCNRKIKGTTSEISEVEAIIGIGNNKARKKLSNELDGKVFWKSVIHPNSIVSNDVKIGVGTIIMAGAIVQPGAIIGNHVIINTGATVDHDCIIEDFVHLAPGVHLAGGVEVGEGTFIGIGSSVIQYIKIGKWCVLGAGSVTISSISDYCVAVGVPSRVIKKNTI